MYFYDCGQKNSDFSSSPHVHINTSTKWHAPGCGRDKDAIIKKIQIEYCHKTAGFRPDNVQAPTKTATNVIVCLLLLFYIARINAAGIDEAGYLCIALVCTVVWLVLLGCVITEQGMLHDKCHHKWDIDQIESPNGCHSVHLLSLDTSS